MDQQARQELEATIAARRELGPVHDEELIAGFLDRIVFGVAERNRR